MKQSYHSYRRRLKLIRCASYNTYLAEAKAEWAADGSGIDAIFNCLRNDRDDRLEKMARRQFEARRRHR